MNNKTIFEFGFRIVWRIMEISEGVRPRRITPSEISIIFHKTLRLIHQLLNNHQTEARLKNKGKYGHLLVLIWFSSFIIVIIIICMFCGYCQFNFSYEHPQVTTPANKRRFIRKLKEFWLNLYWVKLSIRKFRRWKPLMKI